MTFRDRAEAGRRLAELLGSYRRKNAVVLGLARGGVPVAFEVASVLGLPLDALIVQKLVAPTAAAPTIGAVAEGGGRFVDERAASRAGVDVRSIEAAAELQMKQIAARAQRLRRGRPPVSLAGKVAVVIDDGIATGATMSVALHTLHARDPSLVVVGVPIASGEGIDAVVDQVDDIVCVDSEPSRVSIGSAYEDFPEVTDEVVAALLDRSYGWTHEART